MENEKQSEDVKKKPAKVDKELVKKLADEKKKKLATNETVYKNGKYHHS